jgi:cell division protein FtsW (lipid II flippase)
VSRPIRRARGRAAELVLLLAATLVGLAAAANRALAGGDVPDAGDLLPVLALAAAFLAVHAVLVIKDQRPDVVLLPLIMALMVLSLSQTPELAPRFGTRHVTWLFLAVGTVAVVYAFRPALPWLRRYRYTWAVVGLVLVAATLVAGRSPAPGAPKLWLGVGPLQFQPSELLKLLLVVFLAGYLEDKRELLSDAVTSLGPFRMPPLPYLAPLGVMLSLSLLLVAVQGDLGAALLLYATALALLYVASSRISYVVGGLGLFFVGAYVLYRTLTIVQLRAAVWRDPWSDAQGYGYQLVQSLMAIAGGGVAGTGIGAGYASNVPAVHNDMVYAATVEHLGLAGGTAVLVFYLVLAMRGFRIAIMARAPYERLLAVGLTFGLAIQAIIIIGGVVKVIPLTGITLPFLSYGGTSLIVSSITVGLLLRISHNAALVRSDGASS